MGWLRGQLAQSSRKQASEKELAAARKEQAEKGQGSVFESLAAAKEEKTPDGAKLKWVDDSEIGPRNPDLLVRSVPDR